jgi:hypothetical protein
VLGISVTVYWVAPVPPLAGIVTLVAVIVNSVDPHAGTAAAMNPRQTATASWKVKGRPRSCMTVSFPPGRTNPV